MLVNCAFASLIPLYTSNHEAYASSGWFIYIHYLKWSTFLSLVNIFQTFISSFVYIISNYDIFSNNELMWNGWNKETATVSSFTEWLVTRERNKFIKFIEFKGLQFLRIWICLEQFCNIFFTSFRVVTQKGLH